MRLLDLVILKPVLKRARADPELFGGARSVAVMDAQRLFDRRAFDGVPRERPALVRAKHGKVAGIHFALQLMNSAGVTVVLRNPDGTPVWN